MKRDKTNFGKLCFYFLVSAWGFLLVGPSGIAGQANSESINIGLRLGLGLGADLMYEYTDDGSIGFSHDAEFFIGSYMESSTFRWKKLISERTFIQTGAGYYQLKIAGGSVHEGFGSDILIGNHWDINKTLGIDGEWIGVGLARLSGNSSIEPIFRTPKCRVSFRF
jgi:hypothetical protein